MEVQGSPELCQPPAHLEGMHNRDPYRVSLCMHCGLYFYIQYGLVVEAPIKGLGNAAKLVSQDLEVSSGVSEGSNLSPTSEEDMLDLPPDYFDIEGLNGDEGDEGDEGDDEDHDMGKKKK